MADEAADDREAVLLDVALNSMSDVPYPVAAARHFNAAMQAFLGNVQQTLGFQVDLAARIGAGIIAIEAIDLAAGIDRNDVAGADLLLTAGDAVNDRVVHADARRGREAIQVQEVRSCTVAHDKVVDDFVDLCRGNTRLDRLAASLECSRADRTGFPHFLKFSSILDLDHGF